MIERPSENKQLSDTHQYRGGLTGETDYMANNVRQFLRSSALSFRAPEGNANFKSIFERNKTRKDNKRRRIKEKEQLKGRTTHWPLWSQLYEERASWNSMYVVVAYFSRLNISQPELDRWRGSWVNGGIWYDKLELASSNSALRGVSYMKFAVTSASFGSCNLSQTELVCLSRSWVNRGIPNDILKLASSNLA